MTNDNLEEITPEDSIAPVYLDPTPIDPDTSMQEAMDAAEAQAAADAALKDDAVQKLMTDFGFTEEMAKTIVGI